MYSSLGHNAQFFGTSATEKNPFGISVLCSFVIAKALVHGAASQFIDGFLNLRRKTVRHSNV